MRIKRNLLRKKAVTIGAVVIALPLLFGFKAEDGNENLDNKSAVSGQTSGETVDKPFEQAKPSADTTSPTDDKTATADKTTASSTPSTEEKDSRKLNTIGVCHKMRRNIESTWRSLKVVR